MNEEPIHPPAPDEEQPQAACERCGKLEASRFGDEYICDDCYTACGSCCAGEED